MGTFGVGRNMAGKMAAAMRQQPGYQAPTGQTGGVSSPSGPTLAFDTIGSMAGLGKTRLSKPKATGGTGVGTVTRRRRKLRRAGTGGRIGSGTDTTIRDMAPAPGGPSSLSRSRRGSMYG